VTEQVDLARLGAWMDDEGLPGGPITEVELLGGGTQNILLRFTRGGETYVLRHPPPHKRANSDETMRREARVLAAIAGTDVPHPQLIAACGDESVLGSAFYLMEPIDGANPTVGLPPRYLDSPSWRHELGLAMADGAASVGAVDHDAVGLSDLGRAEGYLERQVARWRAQLDSYSALPGYPGPDIPGVDEVGEWLDGQPPDVVGARPHPRRLPPRQRPVLTAPAGPRRHRRLGADRRSATRCSTWAGCSPRGRTARSRSRPPCSRGTASRPRPSSSAGTASAPTATSPPSPGTRCSPATSSA
jgi:hypothetical protein